MFEPIIVIAVVLIVIVTALSVGTVGVRRRALSSLAGRLGARFSLRDPMSLTMLLGDLYFMQKGHCGCAFNVMRGLLRGRRFITFDYRHEIGCGTDREIVKGSFVICHTQVLLPVVVGLAEEPFDLIGGYRHFTAVTVGDPAFDGSFSVHSDEPERLRRTLTQRIRELLLACQGVDWQFHGNYVAFYRPGHATPVQMLRLIHLGVRCCRWLEEIAAQSNTQDKQPSMR